MKKTAMCFIIFLSLSFLVSCSYNPFISNNHLTGSAAGTVIGGAAGAGSVALLGGPKPVIGLAGLAGGAIGYYVTTLRYESGGIIQAGGQVYQIGDYTGIYIPTDNIFASNTDELLPQAEPALASAAMILQRYPNNSIIISGNTSGFYLPRWEQRLSERRAERVAAYLWNAGINDFKENSSDMRRLRYVGYGSFFPISNTYTNKGIRENSRIQIVSYPSICQLRLGRRETAMNNVGGVDEDANSASGICCDSQC